MDDAKSRALLVTALHPSSAPNERLMALAALGRSMARAGLHPSDIAIVAAERPSAAQEQADSRARMRQETQALALGRRVKAQEKALREASREVERLHRRIAELEQALTAREEAVSDGACQIAALEADLAARDRRIAALRTSD